MMDPFLGEKIREVLKRALKQRGLTYRTLAPKLGLSESGVKKLLTAKDLSISRLFSICEVLGLSVSELLETVEREEIREVELSPRQQAALLKEPGLLRLFWRSCIEKEDLHAIRTEERLSENEFRKLISRLENLDLAHLNEQGRIEPAHRGLYRWREGGPLIDRLNHDWSINLLEAALKKTTDPTSLHRLSGLRLNEIEAQELKRRLNDLVDEFARTTAKGRLRDRERKAKPVRLVVAVTNGKLID